MTVIGYRFIFIGAFEIKILETPLLEYWQAKTIWARLMWLWYLSHRRPANAQASLRIRTVSPEPTLFAHIKYGSRRRVRPNISPVGWLRMRVWRISLRWTKCAMISWGGSYYKSLHGGATIKDRYPLYACKNATMWCKGQNSAKLRPEFHYFII